MKNALSSEIPFESPHGDGFVDYLNQREDRKEIADSRVSGQRCIFCRSSDIYSKGKEWRCGSCGRRFSKHY